MENKAKRSIKFRRLKKPIQAIRKLKDKIHKLSKKSSTEPANGAASASRGVEATELATRFADRSRNASVLGSASMEPTYKMGPSRTMSTSRSLEPTLNSEAPWVLGIKETKNTGFSRSMETVREQLRLPDSARSASATDASRNADLCEPEAFTMTTDLSRSTDKVGGADFAYDMSVTRNVSDVAHGRLQLTEAKSPPEKTAQSPPHRPGDSMMLGLPEPQPQSASTEELKALTAESLETVETAKKVDANAEQQLASLNRRLKILVEENEKANKHEEQLFITKNQIIAKIEFIKKQMEEAMIEYRGEAQACREKIEKEEILQNQMLMDLKERVEKLSDMCTDISNRVDDMAATLDAYSISENGVFYIVAACSVDLVVRFFQLLFYTLTFMVWGLPERVPAVPQAAVPPAANAIPATTSISRRKKPEKATTPPTSG